MSCGHTDGVYVYPRTGYTACRVCRREWQVARVAVKHDEMLAQRRTTYARTRERDRARRTAWRAANVERLREQGRTAYQTMAPEKKQAVRARARERTAEWRRRNPGRVNEHFQAWSEAHPDRIRLAQDKHRLRLAPVKPLLVVKVAADHCGVCLKPLTDAPSRHPLSTTVGHEPPLAVVRKEGWLVVVTRPEHFACNRRKNARIDAAFVGAPFARLLTEIEKARP